MARTTHCPTTHCPVNPENATSARPLHWSRCTLTIFSPMQPVQRSFNRARCKLIPHHRWELHDPSPEAFQASSPAFSHPSASRRSRPSNPNERRSCVPMSLPRKYRRSTTAPNQTRVRAPFHDAEHRAHHDTWKSDVMEDLGVQIYGGGESGRAGQYRVSPAKRRGFMGVSGLRLMSPDFLDGDPGPDEGRRQGSYPRT